MKRYMVTSNSFDGELVFKYDLNSLLIAFEIQATLTPSQRDWFFKNLPLNEQTLVVAWPKASKTMRVQEVPEDLSFETFYNRYAYKVGDKKKCQKLWANLTDENKAKALHAIAKYHKFVESTGTAKVYPERFLSKEYYNNEYK